MLWEGKRFHQISGRWKLDALAFHYFKSSIYNKKPWLRTQMEDCIGGERLFFQTAPSLELVHREDKSEL